MEKQKLVQTQRVEAPAKLDGADQEQKMVSDEISNTWGA